MGFKAGRKIYKLVFADPEFTDPDNGDPMVVRAKSMPLGDFLVIMGLIDGGLNRENLDELFSMFAGVLVDWNLEDDDDQPIPTTVAGLYTLEIELARTIINAWREAVEGVSVPLEPSSSAGEPSLVASIPMELPSESLVS